MKNKKNSTKAVFTLLTVLLLSTALLLTWAGCASQPETGSEEREKTASSKTAEEGWIIEVIGARTDTMNQADLEEAKEHTSHYKEVTLEKKGEMRTYMAIPFHLVAAMSDGLDAEHPYVFDQSLWEEGYDITLTAADGYSATFNTAEVPADALYIADMENGEEIPPRVVGEVSGKIQIQDLVTVELHLKDGSEEKVFTLDININNNKASFTLEELEKSPYYIEGRGSFTTSAGTTHTHDYGGVQFADFISNYMQLSKDTTVTVVAMDGYEMTYSGEQLLDTTDGEWILAFNIDGEYMPFDPGYIRTIKVGPNVPNIDGHLSAKMVKEIKASGEPFKSFTLNMTGKMDHEIDRQTMQSGISCHKTTVTYHDRKAEEDIEYTGIPLYLLLAYSDDPDYAPHKQDSSIISYNKEAAEAGYEVTVVASDGFSITLDSRELHNNEDVIIAMYKNGEPLPEREWPLIIVWDKDAKVVPEGIKPVRSITEISLSF